MSDLLIHNPLEEPLPHDPVASVHRMARDLAWGAVNNLWPPRVLIECSHFGFPRRETQSMWQTYSARWDRALPSVHLLVAFGYLNQQHDGRHMTGLLTEKAFDLLKAPAKTPRVFVSYDRKQGSALALLIVARLQLAGVKNPFLDINKNPGDSIHAQLEDLLQVSEHCVCLIGPGTLDSSYMQQEIMWALAQNALNVIPVWYGNFEPDEHYPLELAARNAIRVPEESAEGYNTAVVRLLNRLGFAP